MSTARIYDRPLTPGSRVGILLLIAIAGLLYVKWMPYYSRAFLAASTHSIGKIHPDGGCGASASRLVALGARFCMFVAYLAFLELSRARP
jgi:hypothetical protein